MTRLLALAATALVLVALLGRGSEATVGIRERALEIGYHEADNCGFCHTFDGDHMKVKAREAGIVTQGYNCYLCHHGKNLPLTGYDLLNERGKWLAAEKKRQKAEKVDAVWLSRYPGPSPKPAPAAKRTH